MPLATPSTARLPRFSSRWRGRLPYLLSAALMLAGLGAASAAGLLGPRMEWRAERAWQDTYRAVARGVALARLRFAILAARREAIANRSPAPAPAAGTGASAAKAGHPLPAPAMPATGAAAPSAPTTATGGTSYPSSAQQPRRVGLPSALMYADKNTTAYTRFKSYVDSNVSSGGGSYGFRAADAALMYELSPETKYCTLAVNLAERQVAAAESRIASGQNPEVAGDSYLEAGDMIGDVATTYHTCASFITASQRSRWSAYAEQTVWNIWNYGSAKWGNRSAPWTGWSTSNPGNNYYYSFLEATMTWALASNSSTWLNFLRTNKLPALQAYFAKLPGGGSSEGTGYGTSHMRLFSLYRLWRDGAGVDLANTSPHATDSIYYWIHATVPTLDRFAPIGDQSRNSVPELFDYHRRLVLEARQVSNTQGARNQATWWLRNISVAQMGQGYDYRYDLLPAGATPVAPTDLIYHAKGVGHLFARTGWDRNAMWVAIVAGPYNESHAHQDQGSFTLFAGDWLAVTANIWSSSGINQGTDVHNLVRFVRNGSVARQCESTTRASTLTVTPGSGGAFTANANLTPAFCNNTAVTSWQRQFTFGNRKLTIRDQFSIASGTTATFQINVPAQPSCSGREATAGRLRVRVLEPSNATFSLCGPGNYVEGGGRYRIDVSGGTSGYLVELSEAS